MGLHARYEDDDEVISDINVAPVADIVFVLLIVFMVTTTYVVNPSIEVNLPEAETAEIIPKSTLSIVLNSDGDLYLNGLKTSEANLRRHIHGALLKEGKDLQAILAADKDVPHGKVVGLIDLVKSQGIVRFAINTAFDQERQPPAPPPQVAEPAVDD